MWNLKPQRSNLIVVLSIYVLTVGYSWSTEDAHPNVLRTFLFLLLLPSPSMYSSPTHIPGVHSFFLIKKFQNIAWNLKRSEQFPCCILLHKRPWDQQKKMKMMMTYSISQIHDYYRQTLVNNINCKPKLLYQMALSGQTPPNYGT